MGPLTLGRRQGWPVDQGRWGEDWEKGGGGGERGE